MTVTAQSKAPFPRAVCSKWICRQRCVVSNGRISTGARCYFRSTAVKVIELLTLPAAGKSWSQRFPAAGSGGIVPRCWVETDAMVGNGNSERQCRSWKISPNAWVCGRSFLELWVLIPWGAWMFASCEYCVLSGPITRSEKSYRVWCVCGCDREASIMTRTWSTGVCCAMAAIDKQINE